MSKNRINIPSKDAKQKLNKQKSKGLELQHKKGCCKSVLFSIFLISTRRILSAMIMLANC